MFVLSITINGMPFFNAYTVRSKFFVWYYTIFDESYLYFPFTIKKSSVEYTTPSDPANFFAVVDFPEPGNPLIMISFFYASIVRDGWIYIILLLSYYLITVS